MPVWEISLNVAAGWAFWSLSHYAGHRWWHDEMRKGKETFYAHGERQHHRVYDSRDPVFAADEDPRELFISFPFPHVAMMALVPVAAYGWLVGWIPALCFAFGLYGSMTFDHQLHRLFHRRSDLGGVLGWLQRMHNVHHATHAANFFFVTGFVWDVLLRTVRLPSDPAHDSGPVT